MKLNKPLCDLQKSNFINLEKRKPFFYQKKKTFFKDGTREKVHLIQAQKVKDNDGRRDAHQLLKMPPTDRAFVFLETMK